MRGEESTPAPMPVAASVEDGSAEDARLVASAASGDRKALARLYDRHAGILLAVGVRIVRDRALAEDLLHDVFLEAWHRAAAYDPTRGTVRAWLITRMRSRALDRLGRTARGTQIAQEAQHGQACSLAEGGIAVDRAKIRSVVLGLPEDLGRVVELAYYDGLSSSQIAEHLGVPMGTVKSRMARAVAVLKDRIGPASGGLL